MDEVNSMRGKLFSNYFVMVDPPYNSISTSRKY